jgi:hypothetical protein
MDVSVTGLGISDQYQSTRELRPFNVEVLRLVPGIPEKPLVSLFNLGFNLQLSYYGPFDPFKMEGNADSKVIHIRSHYYLGRSFCQPI